ncbi:uncharacterized protein [Littorina saxatilis]|uniref:uncharacterized protein n=1 Tax=Littorina saxatilis TaxID=31220 RepID=UPI0038B60A95
MRLRFRQTTGSALRYSPELLLENTLESAASPASIYPHFPPSAVSGSNSPANNNDREQANDARPSNKGNNYGNNNDLSFVNSDHDHQANPGVGNANGQGGLRGSEVNNNNNIGQGWSGGAQRVSSNGYVGNTGLRSSQQHDGLHDSYRTAAIPSQIRPRPQVVPGPAQETGVQNKTAVNQHMDDIRVNGLQTADNAPPSQPAVILGQKSPALPEIRQQNAPLGSMYPSFLNAGNKSPEIHQDVDVDGLHGAGQPPSSIEEDLGLSPFLRERPPPPQPFQPSPRKASVSDDGAPGASNQAIPWQQVLSSDIDVDRPVNQPSPAQGTIPGKEERPGVPSPSFGQDDLSDDAFAIEVEFDLDSDENPFREEEDMTGEVPLELALQVIQAMKAEPAWKQYIGSGWEEMEPYWEDDEYDDDYDEDEEYYDYDEEESDEYDDWIPAGNMSPQNSRLITLIIETIGVTEREDDTRDNDMDIWQILTNFPFSMLLGKHNVNEDEYYSEEYDEDEYYDEHDDEYDDDYDTEDEYDEYYDDEDSYDDEDYDDSYDDDDEDDEEYSVSLEDNRATFLKKETDNGSDEDDYYDDDCDDGTLCDDDNNDVKKKDDFTVFSLPPMITKK